MVMKFRILISGPPRHLAGINSNRLPSKGFMSIKRPFYATFISPRPPVYLCMSSHYILLVLKTHFYNIKVTAAVLAQSVERVVDYRAGGRGFDSRGRTNTQGLKITEK